MIPQRYNFEEKANRESTLVGELRELLEKRQKVWRAMGAPHGCATCVSELLLHVSAVRRLPLLSGMA